MQTDAQFYELLSVHTPWLYELLNISPPAKAWMESITVKRIERQIDGVVYTNDGVDRVIEIQFQPDAMVLVRTSMEQSLVGLRTASHSVGATVIFGARNMDTGPKHSPYRHMVQVIYLDEEMDSLARRKPNHPLLAIFAPFLIKKKAELEAEASRCYRQIKSLRLPARTRETAEKVFLYWLTERLKTKTEEEITMILNLPNIEDTVCGRQLLAKGIARGRLEGKAEWKAEGKAEGKAETLANCLVRYFGPTAAALRPSVLALTVEQLTQLEDVWLKFPDVDAARVWLAKVTRAKKARSAGK